MAARGSMSAPMSDAVPSFTEAFPEVSEADWRVRVDAVLKGADFQKKLVARTHDGIAIRPLHAARRDAPLVTGANAASRWGVTARVDHPDPDAAAAQAREDLEGGADALALVFRGGHSARGYGLVCDTVADLDAALAGVHLDLIRLRLDPAPACRLNALMVAALVERRKLDPAQVKIDFGLDPIASLTSLGAVPWDWASMAARLGETVTALLARGFTWPFLTVDLRPYHEAGASEGQELAAALAQGVLYLRALEAHGVKLQNARHMISFVTPVDADQFIGIAKLRALRKLWAQVETACGLPPSATTIHAETSWRMLTRRDPHVNILRGTIAAFAAGIGGADTVTVLPFTQALGLPEAQARRLARNTSIVLMEEANLWRVADPSAGSGGVEALTDMLCAKAWGLFQEIEGEGGLAMSLAAGKPQARIAATAASRAKAIATRKEPITGTSEFAHLAETAPEVLAIRPSKPNLPKARARAKFGMETDEVIKALMKGSSRHDAAPAGSGELKAEPLPSLRLAEPFEALRDRAEAILKKTKRRPGVTLVTLGPLADHTARLAFTRNFFEAGGMEVSVLPSSDADAPPSPESGRRKGASLLPLVGEGGERSETDKGKLLCLVGSDAAYAAEGVALAHKFKGGTLWLAGRPGEMEAALTEAGVSRFVFAGCDVVEALTAALEAR
jgi:methylmalonyl-CoA mutase